MVVVTGQATIFWEGESPLKRVSCLNYLSTLGIRKLEYSHASPRTEGDYRNHLHRHLGFASDFIITCRCEFLDSEEYISIKHIFLPENRILLTLPFIRYSLEGISALVLFSLPSTIKSFMVIGANGSIAGFVFN